MTKHTRLVYTLGLNGGKYHGCKNCKYFVSGVLFGGHYRAILRLASEGRLEEFTSTALLADFEKVFLRAKFGLTVREVEAIIDLVRQTFVLVLPTESTAVVTDDPDDDAVIEAALAANAEVVVSGDRIFSNWQRAETSESSPVA